MCNVPSSAVDLLTDVEQVRLAAHGAEPMVCPIGESMAVDVLDAPHPVVVWDAGLDPRFAHNPFVTGERDSVRFYAAARLLTPAGVVVGTISVWDTEAGDLDEYQRIALQTLAGRVVDVLELRLHSVRLQEVA